MTSPAETPPAPTPTRILARQSAPLGGAIAAFGLMAAAQNTTLSLFLANAVQAAPFLIGLFFTVRAAVGIVAGLGTGWLSDRLPDRRVFLGYAGLAGTAGGLCLVVFRDYWVLLVTTTILLSLGGGAFGQMFAYANEFATAHGRDVTAFSSMIRAVFSGAFVVGAPLGLSVMDRYGFIPLYLGLAALTLASGVIGRWGLLKIPRAAAPRASGERGGPCADTCPLGCGCCSAWWCCWASSTRCTTSTSRCTSPRICGSARAWSAGCWA